MARSIVDLDRPYANQCITVCQLPLERGGGGGGVDCRQILPSIVLYSDHLFTSSLV